MTTRAVAGLRVHSRVAEALPEKARAGARRKAAVRVRAAAGRLVRAREPASAAAAPPALGERPTLAAVRRAAQEWERRVAELGRRAVAVEAAAQEPLPAAALVARLARRRCPRSTAVKKAGWSRTTVRRQTASTT
jgi:hypothetical protein